MNDINRAIIIGTNIKGFYISMLKSKNKDKQRAYDVLNRSKEFAKKINNDAAKTYVSYVIKEFEKYWDSHKTSSLLDSVQQTPVFAK